MEQPSTFSFSYGMKRWWKGGGVCHGKGCGEGRAKANREKKKIREQRGTLKSLA